MIQLAFPAFFPFEVRPQNRPFLAFALLTLYKITKHAPLELLEMVSFLECWVFVQAVSA